MTKFLAAFPPDLYKGVDFTSIYGILTVISNIIEILLAFIAVLAVIFVIYGGIQYITSSGDPGKTATAKSTLTNAVVGVILSAGAYLIVDFLAGRFK